MMLSEIGHGWRSYSSDRTKIDPEALDFLRSGFSKLAAVCIAEGNPFPRDLPECVEWSRKPLAIWGIEDLPSGLSGGAVILNDDWKLEEEFENFLSDSPNRVEIEQSVLLQVKNHCETEGLQKDYVEFRKFVIENAVVSETDMREQLSTLSDDTLRGLLKDAYEPAPGTSGSEGYLMVCPFCGWTMTMNRRKNVIECSLSRCWQLADLRRDHSPELIELSESEVYYQATRGIRDSTISPGKVEIRLYETLRGKGIEVSLWPGFDAYDLGVRLSDGRVWAVDCKDWKNPKSLANDLPGEFPEYGNWERAFYVFPKYRRDLTRNYISAFRDNWKSQPNVEPAYEDVFIDKVLREEGINAQL